MRQGTYGRRQGTTGARRGHRRTGRGGHRTHRSGTRPVHAVPSPRPDAGSQAPNAFGLPFTGFAPARRCGGTRSRAGSLYPTDTILSPW